MTYQFTSDNMDISPSMKSLAEEKLKSVENKIQRVHDDLRSFRVVMNKAPDQQFLVKIFAVVHGKEYFAEETGFTFETALTGAVSDMDRRLRKAKVIATEEDWEDAREAKRFDPENIEPEIQ